ncbi:MAG: asparagine synthase (glutamine-hydrolyzing) [Chloracidobacterium sp.]|nr:asparagine synthase (glutamine-hydrolyzing) [Chloracidobacterium sp.]
MCGIAGMFGEEKTMAFAERREVIRRMCDVITHRGPDDEGFHIEGGLAIGMRRLSIIDVASGRQPISNEDGSVWIVFNGEIYNFAELRAELIARGHIFQTRTDTETIVHLYEDEGERCVERLRGMFAFAIFDRRGQKIFIARDRVGKKPLHYTVVGGAFVFGSEIKSLLQHPEVKREPNLEAISDYLSFGYVPDPATAFRGINKLPPGHTLTFRDGGVSLRRYWDYEYGQAAREPDRPESYYIERLRDLIAESVRLRLVSEVPIGAFLSGGIDSSVIVAMMSREINEPVKTFSIGFNEASFDELRYARIAARHFKSDHHEFVVTPDVCRLVEEIIWHHDEPFADMSCVPGYVVSKMAREFVTVALSGDGGDEVFAGYGRYTVDREHERFERIPQFIRRHFIASLSRALPRSAYGKNFLNYIALDCDESYIEHLSFFNADAKRDLFSAELRQATAGHVSADAFQKIYNAPITTDRLERLLYLDSKTYLPGDILTKVDRMSMAHSIETRAPLLDQKLIEFVETIPSSLKLRGATGKYILKRAVEGLVPDEILHRPKHGFSVPLVHWFNHELREMLQDTLTDRTTRERGYFNQRAIRVLIDEHGRGRRDNSHHLWGFLILELWFRAFIDRRPAPNFPGAKTIKIDQLAANLNA